MNPWTIIGWIVLGSIIGMIILCVIDFVQFYREEYNTDKKYNIDKE